MGHCMAAPDDALFGLKAEDMATPLPFAGRSEVWRTGSIRIFLKKPSGLAGRSRRALPRLGPDGGPEGEPVRSGNHAILPYQGSRRAGLSQDKQGACQMILLIYSGSCA